MTKQNIDSVSFDIIRYANCWEDADALLEGLEVKPGGKILSIGSAGDNCFSLLTTNPSIVIAVDINPNQLYLIELKKACFKFLAYDQILQFLGFKTCNKRLEIYSLLKNDLNFESRQFWDKNLNLISKGVIHQGKFEKYFQTFSMKILPWIHSKAKINRLFENKSAVEQENFYNNEWNNWRWKILFKIFFSKYILGTNTLERVH